MLWWLCWTGVFIVLIGYAGVVAGNYQVQTGNSNFMRAGLIFGLGVIVVAIGLMIVVMGMAGPGRQPEARPPIVIHVIVVPK